MANELHLFGVIGQGVLTAPEVKAELSAMDQSQELIVRIDSPGGSVFAGTAIFNAIKAYEGPKKAVVESFAGSIASYLLTAFDDVEITDNGYVMIHNPSLQTDGDDEDHARDAKLLADIKQDMVKAYASKMGMPEDRVAAMMKSETYFNAADSVSNGLADSIISEPSASRVVEAFSETLPYGVVASLRRNATGGVQSERSDQMADAKTPVAATVKEIKAAFPKMGEAFVVKCLEDELPIAQVAEAAATNLQAQNEELQSKLTAMEEEMESLKAAAESSAKAEAEAKADKATATASADGNQPVAVAPGDVPQASAKVRWSEAIAACQSEGMSKQKAVQAANRRHPGLRQEMLKEVNG